MSIFPSGSGNYVVFDLETTGKVLTGEGADRIVEIAVLEVDYHGNTLFDWETTLNPGKPSHPMAVKQHKLSEQDLAHSPCFSDIALWLACYLDGKTLVAHNYQRFDSKVLSLEFSAAGMHDVDLGVGIDTLPWPSEGFGLDNLRKKHGIKYLAHSAMGDALTLLDLLRTGILEAPAEGCSPFRLLGSSSVAPRKPLGRTRADIYRMNLDAKPSCLDGWRLVKGDPVIFKHGDKVCLSGGQGEVRQAMEAKHSDLGLDVIRSISKSHVAIVVSELESCDGKPQKARELGKPFVRANDFIAVAIGDPVDSWHWIRAEQ